MNLGGWEWVIVAVVVILIFGVGRIGKIGKELGTGIREFRTSIKDPEQESKAEETKEEEDKA